MKILSLYDGMGCGYIALQAAGVPVDRYVAYEIDKYAVKTALHNFPDIEQRGDVKTADFTEFEGFDWVLAGFPCTKFSIAQKKDRETKPYSGEGWELFEQAWRAVCEAKPKYFLFENNKSMAKAVQQEISNIIGFEPVLINSALVSAQNRQRIYWLSVRNADGTYSKVDVEQLADRGILLKDVIDDCCLVERDKAHCLKHQAGNARDYFKKHHQSVGQLRLLRRNYLDLWALLLKWHKDSPVSFKPDGHTVHDFDRRFQLEDEGFILPDDPKFRWAWLDGDIQMKWF